MEENKEVKEKKKKVNKNEEIEALNKQIEELNNEILRSKADLVNYRKRKDEETSNLLKYCNSDLILSLLPIVDNFERALNKKEENEILDNYLEGFKLIYNQVKEILNDFEVKEIEALDKEFNPLYHQSVSIRKDQSKDSGIVLEVYLKGYTYKDKVLRPAMVIINE